MKKLSEIRSLATSVYFSVTFYIKLCRSIRKDAKARFRRGRNIRER